VSLRLLVLDAYAPEGRAELRAGGCTEAGELYARVLRELRPLLNLECPTVTGEALGDRLSDDGYVDRAVIRPFSEPVRERGALVALFGSLAPRGAILKRSAADPKLFEHEGRAVVFTSPEDLAARIDDPDLDVHPDDILVLQNAGPTSPSGMPEAGYLPIPAKLARAGVRDMLRISDARMSGTAFGTVVLHVAPEPGPGALLAAGKTMDAAPDVGKTRKRSKAEEKERKRREADVRNLRSRKLRPLKKRAEELEARIGVLEGEQKERTTSLEDPEVYGNDERRFALLAELQTAQDKLEELTERWAGVSEELEAAEAELLALTGHVDT